MSGLEWGRNQSGAALARRIFSRFENCFAGSVVLAGHKDMMASPIPFAMWKRWASSLHVFGLLATVVFAAEGKKDFTIPAGTADRSLKQFATQSGVEVVYPAEVVRGVRTPEVKGQMTPADAAGRLLTGTGLASARDPKTGALSISRRHDPNGSRAAQKTPSDRPTNPLNSKPMENSQKL